MYVTLADINLTDGAQVDVTSGSANIRARSFSMTDNSSLVINTREQGSATNLSLLVDDSVTLDNSYIFSGVESRAVGKGGNINITTGLLSLTNGAQVIASTFGLGNAGSINISARDRVSFDGTSSDGIFSSGAFSSGAFSSVGFEGLGNGGNINITTRVFEVTNGAQISASTFGLGNAGNINISVSDRVSFDGTSSDGIFSSGAFSSVDEGADGRGGSVYLSAGSLSVTNGAQVSASTFGQGDAGDLNVAVGDSVELIGTTPDGLFASGLTSGVAQGAVGNGGDIRLSTNGRLVVRDGAEVTVSNQGTGNAGSIQAGIFDIRLDNQGKLTAESVSGKGGDIQLQAGNLLLLRRNSLISATSGVPGSNGFDGNININTKFLVAVPSENSDIVATGFGRTPGSNIQINAQGIFGTQFRQQLTSESDIVATGQVSLNIPDVDPSQGLVELPTNLVDASNQIDTSCTPGSRQQASSFVITGRGGLPLNPREAFNSDTVRVDWVTLNLSNDNRARQTVNIKPTTATPKPIIEATGWVKNAKGEVVLTANALTTTPHGSWSNPASCTTSRS